MSGIPPEGSYCDIRDVHEKVGRALVQIIALTHRAPMREVFEGVPIETLADLASIRQEVLDVTDDAAPVLARVGSTLNLWAWFRFLGGDVGVRPDDVAPEDPGRWVEQALPDVARCSSTRYLAHVEYLADQVSPQMLWDRCRGQTPALFVSPTEDAIEEHSQTGAVHRIALGYRIRVLSANWRGGVTARFTAPLGENIEDPGTQRILGDVRRILIHDWTVLQTLGVVKPILGPMRPERETGAERTILDSMTVHVIAYTYTPNTPCEVVDGWRMWLQLQDLLGRNAGPLNDLSAPQIA